MLTRLILIAGCCVAILLATWTPSQAEAKELTIGSKAPALDIEHWVQDGNGFFKPVTKFKEGHVYVVEFWATWCGPCIMSMPHLAELQAKYRGEKVQIISISDEDLETVKEMLERDHPQAGKKVAEVTAAYSLTTDPDGSTHKAYMEAANQQGIPTSFIVGKDGMIEWIGHPMEMDEPLAAVVNDKWDRAEYLRAFKEREELEKNYREISMLAQAKKFDEAIALAEKLSKAAENPDIKKEWVATRHSLKLSAGQVDDDVVAFFEEQLESMKDDPMQVGQFAYSIHGVIQMGGKAGKLLDSSIKALNAVVEDSEPELKPFLLDTLARLNDDAGKTEAAIAAMEKALESATDQRQKNRMKPFLDQLKEKLSKKDK